MRGGNEMGNCSCTWERNLHPAEPSFKLPVGPSPMSIETVGSKGLVQVGREPSSGAARLGQPSLSALHQLSSNSATFVLWKHCDDQ